MYLLERANTRPFTTCTHTRMPDAGVVVTVDDILGSEAYKNSTSKPEYFFKVNCIDVEID